MPRAYAGVGRGNGFSWLFPMKASPTASLDEGTILAVHTALFDGGCEGIHCGEPPGTPPLLTCSNRQRETVRSTGLCSNENLSGFRHQLYLRIISTVRKATKPRLLGFLPKQQPLSSQSECKQVSLLVLPMSCPITGPGTPTDSPIDSGWSFTGLFSLY